MAQWCLQTGQGPGVYRELTRLERKAFEDEARAIVARMTKKK